MKSLFQLPARKPARATEARTRALEATPEQLIGTGALAGMSTGYDPLGEPGPWRRVGTNSREVPWWTHEKARANSVAAYRSNPMAKAIVDTYVAFAVGDVGVSYQCTNPDVKEIVDEFWNDPRNNMGGIQELLFRDCLIMGETCLELIEFGGGRVRFAPVPVSAIQDVTLINGNTLWPDVLLFDNNIHANLNVVRINDETDLREGEAMFWAPFKTLTTDIRSMPFLTPIIDWLDSYDTVLSNMIDRTALARYLVWDVTVQGGQDAVDNFLAARGGTSIPRSGTIEVHNESVEWKPQTVPTGAQEDSVAGQSVMTVIAGGAGLSKAQPLDCKVLTPQGWRYMGELNVGDEVTTPQGKASKILGVYPQGEIEAFEVRFSDGAKTRASGEHLWMTQTRNDRNHNRPGSVKTTEEIVNSIGSGHMVPIPDLQECRGIVERVISEVTSVGTTECQCILIDDPEHLYVTDDYIVTHNTWLAEPEGANRATSLSMAEPVRRRVQGVQKQWLGFMTELVRFVVDRAVANGKIPALVTSVDEKTGQEKKIPASQTVIVTGPEVAAADSQITAQVLLNLSTGLQNLIGSGALSAKAGEVAARKAWEDYVGIPYTADLDDPNDPANKRQGDTLDAAANPPAPAAAPPNATTQGANGQNVPGTNTGKGKNAPKPAPKAPTAPGEKQ